MKWETYWKEGLTAKVFTFQLQIARTPTAYSLERHRWFDALLHGGGINLGANPNPLIGLARDE
uniref:Uncharacterized protein n=1 Tax=Candidozyma auris TaxID=498019 RepID=A0A0L0P7Y0_CANAR